MYTLVYYVKRTENGQTYDYEYPCEEFRLKKDALHFMRGRSKEGYIERGYAVEDVKNGLNCYRNKMNAEEVRETVEIRVRIEKI